MPTLERARAKHDAIVAELNKMNARREKTLDDLTRINAKRAKLIRSEARSKKRLNKLRTQSKPKAVTLAELPATEVGKANAKSWDAIPAVRKRKPRRTPDDFKADMAGKKLAAGLGDGGQV